MESLLDGAVGAALVFAASIAQRFRPVSPWASLAGCLLASAVLIGGSCFALALRH